ncbi:hypothetical protein ACH4VR_13290 [Streptomyces sp. NPDC020883]|uniref:hypothetical protein n=1 Tax=Streptomyces sp. NPDC020883 TaxID=3365099 RepID=UPI0037AEBE9F
MHEHLDALEARMQQLQREMREARMQHDSARFRVLSEELQRTLNAYNALFGSADAPEVTPPQPQVSSRPQSTAAPVEPGLPVRERVHQVLTLLTVPAAPKLVSQVHEAFFSGPLNTARLAAVRRDDERSFRSSPYARAWYICAALTSDLLAPARALLALSTWPLERRVVGPLTHRVHFLTSALRLAEAAQARADGSLMQEPMRRLLLHYTRNIPGCPTQEPLDLDALRRATAAELAIHAADDADARAEAARRAQELLDVEQLFGNTLRNVTPLRRTS